jgi:hypothetical protein
LQEALEAVKLYNINTNLGGKKADKCCTYVANHNVTKEGRSINKL